MGGIFFPYNFKNCPKAHQTTLLIDFNLYVLALPHVKVNRNQNLS